MSSTSTASSSTTPTATKTIELKLGQQSATVQVTPAQEQDLDKLLDMTLRAMQDSEAKVEAEAAAL